MVRLLEQGRFPNGAFSRRRGYPTCSVPVDDTLPMDSLELATYLGGPSIR